MVHSGRTCGPFVFAGWLAIAVAFAPLCARAQSRPDLSNLSTADQNYIEQVCADTKRSAPEAAYFRCLQIELDQWAHGTLHKPAVVRPSVAPPAAPQPSAALPPPSTPALTLSSISAEERRSIESACSSAKLLSGAAAYSQCVQNQLTDLAKGPRRPDLSGLSPEERNSIESACASARLLSGPALYNRCLQTRVDDLTHGARRPSLSGLSQDQRNSIEAACSTAKLLSGPAAYNQCLQTQLKSVDSHAAQSPAQERQAPVQQAPAAAASPTPAAAPPQQQSRPAAPAPAPAPRAEPIRSFFQKLTGTGPKPGSPAPRQSQARSAGSAPSAANAPNAAPEPVSPSADSGSWLATFFWTLLVLLAIPTAWYGRKYLPKRVAKCPRCQSPVPVSGALCANCALAFQQELQEAEARQDEVRRAYSQRQAEDRARREEERRAREAEEGAWRAKVQNLEQLAGITDREFEDMVAWLFHKEGYATRPFIGSADEGIDLILQGQTGKDVAQRRRAEGEMGAPAVRDFYGALMHAGARHGFVVTTAVFSEAARTFARGKPITLISGPQILRWVEGTYSARTAAQHPQRIKAVAAPVDVFDPFSVLGVPRDASQDAIHAAYRRAMSNYHPDKVAHLGAELQEFAQRKAQEINRAYRELIKET